MWTLDEKALVGEKIKSFTVQDEDRAVLELIDGREFEYRVEGDCCSSSWIEHITVPNDIEGATLLAVKDGHFVDITTETNENLKEGEWGYDCLLRYQTAFVTDRGEIIFEYRNSSNGYYGGYMIGPWEVK